MFFLLPSDSSLTQITLLSVFDVVTPTCTTVFSNTESAGKQLKKGFFGCDFSLIVSLLLRIKQGTMEIDRNYYKTAGHKHFKTVRETVAGFQKRCNVCSVCKIVAAVDIKIH